MTVEQRMKTLALCAGYGGLEMGLELAGWPTRLVAYAEIDPHAASVMARHHPNVPNLGDLTTITEPPHVDIVTAGFPCQPVSSAGARKGTEDERWIIRDVVSVWQRSGARWLLLENVLGLLSANDGEAFGQVVDALAEVGATVEWACVRASDVGAPHRRERWFALARNPQVTGTAEVGQLPKRRRGDEATNTERAGRTPSDTRGIEVRSEQVAITERIDPVVARLDHETSADPDSQGFEGRRCPESGGRVEPAELGDYWPALARWAAITGHPVPPPTTLATRRIKRHPTAAGLTIGHVTYRARVLNPRFPEFMMGLPPGHVTDTPELSRSKALAVIGNGVVPQQAAAAIQHLLERHTAGLARSAV